MLLVTIQDKKVLDLLKSGKFYEADFYYIFNKSEHDESDKMKAYQILMKHFSYTAPPIFCSVPLRYTDFGSTNITKNSIILELSIPDNLVHLISMRIWHSLLIHCMNHFMTDEKYENYYYENYYKEYLTGKDIDDTTSIQAIIPYIKPEWLISAYNIPDNFIKYFDSGRVLFSSMYSGSKQIYSSF